jgi:hypothetical protein
LPTRSRKSKDFAPRVGATYRLSEKTVLRAGFGIYYNPNQMNSFTFLTNNPPLAVVSTYTSDTANPTLSFDHPTGIAAPALHRPLRQLGEQPGGRRSRQRSDVGRPELGRDDDRVLQPGLRRQSPG